MGWFPSATNWQQAVLGSQNLFWDITDRDEIANDHDTARNPIKTIVFTVQQNSIAVKLSCCTVRCFAAGHALDIWGSPFEVTRSLFFYWPHLLAHFVATHPTKIQAVALNVFVWNCLHQICKNSWLHRRLCVCCPNDLVMRKKLR